MRPLNILSSRDRVTTLKEMHFGLAISFRSEIWSLLIAITLFIVRL